MKERSVLTAKLGQRSLNSVTPSLVSSGVLHTILAEKVEVILEQVKSRAERSTEERWTNTVRKVAMRSLGAK